MADLRQTAAEGNTSTNSRAVTLPINVRNNTYLYIVSGILDSAITITGITDSQGNTWAKLADEIPSAVSFELWRAPSATAGAVTITVNYSGTDFNYVFACEVDGEAPGSTISNGVDSASADPVPGATLSPTDLGMAFCIIVCDTGTITFNAISDANGGNGWTMLPVAGTTTAVRAMARTVKGVDTLAPVIDVSAARASESMTTASYHPAVGGGGGEHAYAFFG